MKKKTITKKYEEISIEEAVNEFFLGDWDPSDWSDTYDCIDYYIEEDLKEVSEEEEALLKEKIKKSFDERVSEIKQEEIDKLKDKKSILDWLDF